MGCKRWATLSNIKINRMEKIDIKYLGIPNICFSLTDKEDGREPELMQQRRLRGFDDSETWSLTDTIANFIIPRLERYEEIANDVLQRDDKLKRDINLFLVAMKLLARDHGARIFTKREQIELEKGLKVFPKIFVSLWW